MLGGSAEGADVEKTPVARQHGAVLHPDLRGQRSILLSALSVLGAILYNIAASLIGGIGVTLRRRLIPGPHRFGAGTNLR
ncbi:DUF3566 domain-containing protein [Kocuria rhizophila]|nr:DUF3566 domain-containing protein [Kocuria rhizophila]